MRVGVTGAGGFLGGHLVRRARADSALAASGLVGAAPAFTRETAAGSDGG